MLTSYYSKWSKLNQPGGISISRSQSRYTYPVYSPLAPGSWFRSVGLDDYVVRYNAQLAKLDPQEVWDDLHTIAKDNAIRRFGLEAATAAKVEPVIMCWEAPGAGEGNFCHRRLASMWLAEALGKEIPEGVISKAGNRVTVGNWDTLATLVDGKLVKLPSAPPAQMALLG